MSKITDYTELVNIISNHISISKNNLYQTINRTVVFTYWKIGEYIVEYEQKGENRAKYGTELLKNLSNDLTIRLGKGFSWRNLYNMKKFYIEFPFLQTLSANYINKKLQTPSAKSKNDLILESSLKLSWSHFVRLLSVKDKNERDFYLIESAQNRWSERELNRQINSALYERIILSKDENKVKELSTKGQIIRNEIDLIKDPLILEFLDIKQNSSYSENDLESAIIENLEKFLLELGKGFSFVSRQYRLSSGTEHFYVDLVFYNRLLSCFVLIDLKIGKLKHQDIGQMLMYVNYFDREVKTKDEKPTIGIILCKENDDFVIEYTLPKENKQIFSKEYKLYLPNKVELKKILKNYI